MAKLDEKNVASVKKTVSVAAPTGGIKLSAYDKAAGTKFLKGGVADKAAQSAVGTMMAGRAAAVQGKGGQTMGGKATAAKGKGGPTMGQKAAIARGQGGPVVQAIKNKLTGKPAAAASAPAAKKEELKISTYNLPTAFQIGDDENATTYDFEGVMDAIKKTESTYGKSSRQYRALLSALGNQSDIRPSFTGKDYKKPDLRKDAGKSYVDTAQTVLGAHSFPRFKPTAPDYGHTDDQFARALLEQFGVKKVRNLNDDPRSVRDRD